MRNKINISSIILGIVFMSIAACGGGSSNGKVNDFQPVVTLSSEKELLTFTIVDLANSESKKSEGIIKEDTVTLHVPPNNDSETYNINFTISEKATLSINGQNLVSPVKNIELNNDTQLIVTAENKSTKTYLLEIIKETTAPSSEKELLTFALQDLVNSENVNSEAIITTDDITLYIPPHHNKDTYNFTFTISDKATLSINGQNLTSPANDIELNDTDEILITAENDTTKTFKLSLIKELPKIDDEVQSFMTKYSIPGGVFGIIKNEQLVYLRALGQATDTTQTAVNTLFRIASISKPITLVTILKMVETGSLSLDQTVFGPNSILGMQYGQSEYSSFEQMITVEHLINHTAGWQNTPNDPMFLDSSLSQDDIINLVLTEREPVTEPGSNYFYSNFSYLLLGKIIEKVSGMGYSEYVNKEILNPVSINNMLIAGNTLNQRLPNEAQYYSLETVSPYQLNVTRMAAHGGWIGSASSLARFLVHVDRNSLKTDILSTSYNNFSYLGYENWYHTGSLSGSSAYISRINNNYGFVALFNSRSNNDSFWLEFNNLAKELVNQNTLPNYDLFNAEAEQR